MTKTELLKEEILKQYRSVRSFANELDIPYSTLVTALERGIESMSYGSVIKICDRLELNPIDFTPLSAFDTTAAKIMNTKLYEKYLTLNKMGRKKVYDMIDDFSNLQKYTDQ